MRIYIAGPIASRKETYKQDFAEAEHRLRHAGEIPVNPAWLPEGLDGHAYMPICTAMIDACDAIYMMTGWQRSNGARQEHDEAVNHGLKFFASMAAIPETDAARAERLRKYRQEEGTK